MYDFILEVSLSTCDTGVQHKPYKKRETERLTIYIFSPLTAYSVTEFQEKYIFLSSKWSYDCYDIHHVYK